MSSHKKNLKIDNEVIGAAAIVFAVIAFVVFMIWVFNEDDKENEEWALKKCEQTALDLNTEYHYNRETGCRLKVDEIYLPMDDAVEILKENAGIK